MSAEEWLDIDGRFFPGKPDEPRPLVRSLGRQARDFMDSGGPPPVPAPVFGQVSDVDLPLFYPGLNGLAGPSGVGKSLLSKFLLRQAVWDDRELQALVFDCETTEVEYAATLAGDLTMGAQELDRVHYATDRMRQSPGGDRWSGKADDLEQIMAATEFDPGVIVMDSQSKSMAVCGLNEVSPADVEEWFEKVTEPLLDRWPSVPLVLLQGRQKGWSIGQDKRQGRGSSALLHEVICQYMLWPGKHRGSRTVDGDGDLVCTKDRYGHRVEASKAAQWRYGPSGFALNTPAPDADADLPDADEISEAVLAYLDDDPHDAREKWSSLPPTTQSAVEAVAATLGIVSAKGGREGVAKAIARLVKAGKVRVGNCPQPVPGARPERVWSPAREQPEWVN